MLGRTRSLGLAVIVLVASSVLGPAVPAAAVPSSRGAEHVQQRSPLCGQQWGEYDGVECALMLAWQQLGAVQGEEEQSLGRELRTTAINLGLTFGYGPLLDGGIGQYRPEAHAIVVNRELQSEDPRALAAVLAHLIEHASQAQVGATCSGDEIAAYRSEAAVWKQFWPDRDYGPSRTPLELRLNEVYGLLSARGPEGLAAAMVTRPVLQAPCHIRP
ncbi:MAG: hypothetical protein IT305_11870 [Chloroflexi bacterium]|nr:hypothetical protein [Chloroflexota bacterium]